MQVGKGTFGKLISRQLGIPHISAGEILRREIDRRTPLGLQVQPLLSSGQLIPDTVIAEAIERELKERSQNGNIGFILDGFPRTVAQAKLLDSFTTIDIALHITLARWVAVAKLKGRLLCEGCGKSFNSAHIVDPPYRMPAILQNKETCSRGVEYCNNHGTLVGRSDDTDEVVENRLQVYDDTILPILDYYKGKSKLETFDVITGVDDTQTIIRLLCSSPRTTSVDGTTA